MKFNYEKALNDEMYSMCIPVGKNDYDDYIFIISCIYGSNISLDKWIQKIKDNPDIFKSQLYLASVIHCNNWNNAILEIAENYSINCENNNFKSSRESRNWVQQNITPILLKFLLKNGEITIDNVIYVLELNK